MVYLPHLDYDHQRFGPNAPESLRALGELDALVGDLVGAADRVGAGVVCVSEYGIREVSRAVAINIRLREAGLLVARQTPDGDVLDPFGSQAFALVDHQIAHVYCQGDRATRAAQETLEGLDGLAALLDDEGKRAAGLDHPNAGTLIALSSPDAWFNYTYWMDASHEPDFARTVDIHRKPGYDPLEMFLDPNIKAPKLRVARRLARKKLGFRYLMDVIPVDPGLIGGSHGLVPDDPAEGPVWLASDRFGESIGEPNADGTIEMTSVKRRVLGALFGGID